MADLIPTPASANPQFLPVDEAKVAAIMVRYGRRKIEAFIEIGIGLVNADDGDTDLEPNGDETDSDGDEHGDTAWIEWTSLRGSQKSGPNILAGAEDAEDDENGGDDVQSEDEPGFEPADRRWANRAAEGAGCKISDDDVEHNGCEDWR